MSGETGLRLECPAKVNLFLRIVRRREDGYHELETVFQSVAGGDTLEMRRAGEIRLDCDRPEVPRDESNLVWKAAELLRRRFGRPDLGAALRLVKRTPAGAGMGGGSVDAAAALVGLARLWDLDAPAPLLAEIAAEIGSDVPFFLTGGTALARGRGELLEPLPTPSLWLVLVRPPVSVDTGWAYRQWRPERCAGPSLNELVEALRTGLPERAAAALRNDLEPGVAAAVPEIAAARGWLQTRGALGVRMTGSGSVVFGLARNEAHAREVAAGRDAPGRVWVTRTLNAEEAALRPVPIPAT